MCWRLSRLLLGSHTFSSRQYSCRIIPKTTKLQALESSSNRGTPTRGLRAVLLNQFSKHYHYFGYKRLWNDKHGTLGEITKKQLYDPPVVKRFFSTRQSPLHSAVCKDNSLIYLVHVKRRMLSTLTSCNVSFRLTPMTKIAGAVSLACFRSHLTPRILAAIIGPVALARNITAEAEALQSNYSLRSQTLDRHAFFTTHMWLLLEGIVLTFRMFYLFILFSPAIITAPLVWNVEEGRLRALWLKLVHKTLEQAGAAFIKWGQWAATRPDLFPRDLCTELSQLHSQAPAHKFSYTKNTIERAFGRKINEIFEDFEEEPVASGSIAQVHKASLRFRYPGQKMKPITVAVKVRHPRVSEDIRRDFIIINWIAKVTSILPPLKWLRLEESVQQFAVFMLSQVDLAREAAHLSRFLYNFRRWKDVSFPKPLYPLVHPAVLVETYEHGESVARYVDQPEPDNRLNRSLAHIGTHTLLKMLLVDNFIHADMHPGNILVRVGKGGHSNKRLFRSKPHVIFLDVGMTAELSPTDRVNLLEFFKAVALRDGRTAAECTLKFSRHQSCPDREAFIKEVEQSFKFWGSADSDDVHPAECMHDLLDQVRRHKVNIDGNVCTVMVTTLVLEGWQRKLDPQYNVMDTLQKLLFRADWAKSLSYTIEGLMAP